MHNAVDNLSPLVALAPDRRLTAVAGAAALATFIATIATGDPVARVLLATATVVLGCYALGDVVFRPRVTADTDGIVLNSPFVRARLAWADIEVIDVVTRTRLGLRSAVLEIDAGPVLAEFSRRSLGMEPEHALSRILACRPG